jgi:hypothetical protein
MAAWTESLFLQALGWATLNSLWQMALLWAVFSFANYSFRLSATRKYQASVGAILTGFAWFLHLSCFITRTIQQPTLFSKTPLFTPTTCCTFAFCRHR